MERYFNTLKNDLIYQHYYHTEEELYTAIEEFAYVQYNHVRPHSYNNYKTPYEARYGVVTIGGNLILLAKNEKLLILANRIGIMGTYY